MYFAIIRGDEVTCLSEARSRVEALSKVVAGPLRFLHRNKDTGVSWFQTNEGRIGIMQATPEQRVLLQARQAFDWTPRECARALNLVGDERLPEAALIAIQSAAFELLLAMPCLGDCTELNLPFRLVGWRD